MCYITFLGQANPCPERLYRTAATKTNVEAMQTEDGEGGSRVWFIDAGHHRQQRRTTQHR